jgi:hypothetical protein
MAQGDREIARFGEWRRQSSEDSSKSIVNVVVLKSGLRRLTPEHPKIEKSRKEELGGPARWPRAGRHC